LEKLGDDDDDVDMSRPWEGIRRNIKASATEVLYKLKLHKALFDGECLKLLDQKKQAKLQCL
jgi:hypothetical protein